MADQTSRVTFLHNRGDHSGNHLLVMAGSVVAGFCCVGASSQAAIVAPAGLQPGDKFNLVFISDGTIAGTSANASDYDSLVAAEAAAAGINSYHGSPVTWKAIVSTANGTNAISRFDPAAGSGIYRIDGIKVADDGADLWDGTIQNTISVDASSFETVAAGVWTGTGSDGNAEVNGPFNKALGNTDPLPFNLNSAAEYGNSANLDSYWTAINATDESTMFHLYAFSNELTVAPEPASIGALGLGLLALARRPRAVR